MSIEITQKVGTGINVTIRAEKQKEAVETAAFFGDLPSKCQKCGCENLTFTVRRPETFVYYGLKCKGCLAEFQFGQYKDGSGLFPKYDGGWQTFEERMAKQNSAGGGDHYQDNRQGPPRGAPPPPRGGRDGTRDDIPF